MHSCQPIHPAVRAGHVRLRIVDLDRAIAFHRDARERGTATTPSPGRTGLHHVAFVYPGRSV